MSQAGTAITFGIELEMAVSYGREEIEGVQWRPEHRENDLVKVAIGKTIKDLGYGMDPFYEERTYGLPHISVATPDMWSISGDPSIKRPVGVPVHEPWWPVELKTRVLPNTPESFLEVASVIFALNRDYKLSTHPSTECGLHVHVGHENRGYDFPTLKKLCAFFYTFENYIEAVHPPHRKSEQTPHFEYATPMRIRSGYASRFEIRHNTIATNEHFVSKILGAQNYRELIQIVGDSLTSRYAAYNITGMMEGEPDAKPTIEFRQHQACIEDPEKILTWAQTVIGFVQFVESLDIFSFYQFITKALEAEELRIKNETPLSVADVTKFFVHIGLQDSAQYYQDKLYLSREPERKPWLPNNSSLNWDFEEETCALNGDLYDQMKETRAYKKKDALVPLWLNSKLASDLLPKNGQWKFDEDSPQWPTRYYKEGGQSGRARIPDI